MAERIRDDAASPSCLLEEGTRKLDKHPNKLLEGLNRLRLNKVLCDVILCCEGQEFPCHRVVLASISSYFEAMFTTSMLESTQERVKMDGVAPEVVDMLVNFAYTSEVSISTANVQALLAGADLMDVTDVQEVCCDFMESHIDTDNCVEIHLLADKYSCKKLEKSSMDYILKYFSVIYKQKEFLSVSVDKLTEILSSDLLIVPEEDMVFDAAILWLNTCPDHRLTFATVLEHIRLPLISHSYLHTVIESLDVVKESQGCQRFISEAKTYQRLISEAEDQRLLSYRNTARPRRTTVEVIWTMGFGYADTTYEKGRQNCTESFDPRTKQWKCLPCPFSRAVGPAIIASDMGTVLYLAGGEFPGGSFSKEMWRYDLHRNTLLEMAPMNKARWDCSLVMLDGCVFAMGGVEEEGDHMSEKSVERYDPNSNTWELMQSVNMPELGYKISSLAALDGLIYVFGVDCSDHPKQVHKYNPITGEWTELAPMQSHRSSVAACTLNGKIYAIGGENSRGFPTAEVACYNPETDQWTMCAPMQKTHVSCHVTVVDGKIYVLEEFRGSDIERYCAETDTWETVGKMFADRSGLRCVSVRLRNDAPYIKDPADVYDSEQPSYFMPVMKPMEAWGMFQ